jgi:lysophospholipase L1-like esterase
MGTNDLRNASADDIPVFIDNLEAILRTIYSFSVNNNKRIVIFVARIIDQKPSNPLVSAYNEALSRMVRERIEQDYPIILVNMQTGAGLDYQADISDNFQPHQLHPTSSGYTKMAELWFRTLVSVIGPP